MSLFAYQRNGAVKWILLQHDRFVGLRLVNPPDSKRLGYARFPETEVDGMDFLLFLVRLIAGWLPSGMDGVRFLRVRSDGTTESVKIPSLLTRLAMSIRGETRWKRTDVHWPVVGRPTWRTGQDRDCPPGTSAEIPKR
ncbi:MAG: hypothetical protein FJ295_12880 [Planctomycetes bacterium]|nr:hypothetical protein [Planctomycetota bacterium]